MKQLRHVLALTLVFCMVFGMVTPSLAVSGEISVEEDYGIPVEEDGGIEIEVDDRSDYDIDEDREELSVLPKQDETADETNTTGKVDGYNYNIIHLDCGRKYFSVDSIKKIIDNASAAGFNYIQLAVGNDGMRFLLDDMSLKIDENTTYSSEAVKAAIHAGNETYNKTFTEWDEYKEENGRRYFYTTHHTYTPDVNELTQTEMDSIIAYAYEKKMGVIPLINTPGHMDAILAAATSLTGTNCAFSSDGRTSVRTIDVTPDSTAVKFTKAFLNKYITYFAGKGCKYFNMGADEYANDAFSSGSMGFGKLQDLGKYGYFVTYVNEVAALIKNAGMTPMAFNDGIYFNNNTWSGTFDTNIIIEYWSSGWSSYIPMSASGLADKEFAMVNTNGDYYWVLGKPDAQCSATKASGFDKSVFPGSTISTPGGSTFCIWSDYPGDDTEGNVVKNTTATISAFGGTLPTVDSITNGGTTDPAGETVTVTVDGTVTVTQNGVNNAGNVNTSELDESIATVVVTGTDKVEGNVSYSGNTYRYSNVVTSTNGMAKINYYYKVGVNYYPVYAYKSTYGSTSYYYISYSKTDDINDLTPIIDGSRRNGSITLYTKSGTDPVPASTTITITGKTVGTTYITVGGVRYTINVVAEDLTKVEDIIIEYWITNSRISDTNNKNSLTITAQQAYGEDGLVVADHVAQTASKDGRTQEYWQSKILDVEKTNTSTSGTELQTTKEGDDETLNGSAFTKIRYYNSKWQVYTTEWTDVNRTKVTVGTYTGDKNQLVAYYMEVIDIKNDNGKSELHVNAADWGSKGNGGQFGFENRDGYCSVSVQIVYEDNTTNPTDTTVDNLKSKTIVYGYWNGGRGLGTMIFSGQQNYQIYKVTAETGDMTNTMGSSGEGYPVTVKSFTWDKNEETVWEGDATKSVSIGNPAGKPSYVAPYDNLAWNTSKYNNNNAILIRVYVKAAATEDSLTVHYIDKTLNEEFYNYNIAVASGTYFDSAFGKGGGNTLVNNSVKNINGVTQSVNSNLKEMHEISSYYRFSNFTLEEVVRSADGKEVTLYYTFNNRHDFVVDFGVPLHLDPADIGIDGEANWTKVDFTKGNELYYGKAKVEWGKGLDYTPNKVMTGVETIAVDLIDENSESENNNAATHFIYLYPATNVLYEENVITNPGTEWTKVNDNNYALPIGVTTQSAEKLGEENLHGYDDYYSENTGFSGGSAYKATLDASKTATEYGKPLTFEFTGNGFDLISECGPQTGALLVRVYKDGVLNHGFFVDTYFTGDNIGIINSAADVNGVLDYQVPVVRDINLTHGTYKVEVYGYMVNRSTTSTASLYSVDSAETYLEQALKDLGLDDDASLYEVSYMDENSVLNDNAVASDVVRSGVSVQSMANDVMAETDATQYVYVDGIRVYHTIDVAVEPEYTASEQDVTYYDIYDIAKKSAMTIGSYLVYVEGEGNRATLENYHNKGPQNEIYLTSGNTLAFKLNGYKSNQIIGDSIQVSLKAVTTDGTAYASNGNPIMIDTNTEMYYSLPILTDNTTGDAYIIISCKTGVLSIGAIKLPERVTIGVATESIKADVLRRVKAADSEEFEPSIFTVNVNESVKSGKRFSIGALTSRDADKLIIEYQGVEYEITPDNAELVSLGVADVYAYSCIFKAPKRGVADSVTVTVKAHKAGTDDVYSAPVTRTVVVK